MFLFPLFLMFLFILLAIGGLVVWIFFMISSHSALNAVAPPYRRMPPGNVFLILIPLFGIVWQFIVVGAVADSLRAEYLRRGQAPPEERPGYNAGITGCILLVCSIIPWVGFVTALIGLIFIIMYIQRINNYRRSLEQSGHWQQYPQGLQASPYGYQQQPYTQPYYNQPNPGQQQYPPPNQYQQPNYGQQNYYDPNQQQNTPPPPPDYGQQNYFDPNQQQNTPPPPPQNPNDQSKWMPPGE